MLLYFWLFLKLKLTFSFHTEFVSFINLIVALRVCFVNISPSFNKLTITFVYDFPSTPHPHTYFSPKNTRLLVNVLVSGEEPLLVRRFLIKTPLGKPQRLLVKLLLLLLNNKNKNTKIYNNEANYSCYLRSQVSAIFSMRTLYL